jgi:hypothetical protein
MVRRDATVNQTPVREVMTTPVVTAEETMPLRHLMALLYSSGIGAVPVTDPEHRVLGVVSNADHGQVAGGLAAAGGGADGLFRDRAIAALDIVSSAHRAHDYETAVRAAYMAVDAIATTARPGDSGSCWSWPRSLPTAGHYVCSPCADRPSLPPVGLDYWTWPGRQARLGSSLSDPSKL